VPDLTNKTLRMIVHTTVGGSRVRIQLENAFGDEPVAIGTAHIAIQSMDSAIAPGSDHALTFGGNANTTLLPGIVTVSDPVDLAVPAGSNLAVSLYVSGTPGPLTVHNFGLHTSYVSKEGDFTGAASIDDPATFASYVWLSNVDVLAPASAAAVVALGDSITDGFQSTMDANKMWVAVLADRLRENKATSMLGVANEGISGNRLLREGAGTSALGRFDRDALDQPGVKWIILSEGLNDLGDYARPETADKAATADDIIAGYRQAIERAHIHGDKIIGCTMTPYEGSFIYSDKGEELREKLNEWIRTSGAFDGIIDSDAAVRSSDDAKHIRADFDSGDQLHPNDAGYKAMADSIDLSIFTASASSRKKR
jgi:lysophospholipase L1-like esterase